MVLDGRCKSIQFIIVCVLLTTVTAYLSGSLKKGNGQTTLLLRDVCTCLRVLRHFSISQHNTRVYDCIRDNLHSCVAKKPVPISESIFSGAPLFQQKPLVYCGSIWVKEDPPDAFEKQIVIEVVGGHHIHFSILLFNFSLLRLHSSGQHVHCLKHCMEVGTEKETEMYCGLRIPWTLLVSESKAVFRLVITKYTYYSLQMFYSGFHPNWVENVSQVMTHVDYLERNYIQIPRSLNTPGIYLRWHEFHLVVNPPAILMLQVVWLEKTSTSLQIHDGPGPLSNILYKHNKKNAHANAAMKSTSFSAFARIASAYRSGISVRIYISISANSLVYDFNVRKLSEIITTKSREDRNTARIYSFRNSYNKNYIISLKSFTYNGPDMISSVSPNVCQYGALVIYFTFKQEVVYCESISDLTLYSTAETFTVVIAWFSGYSRGKLILISTYMNCNALYGEFLSPEERNNSDVTLKIGQEGKLCSILICPPALSERKTRCVIKLGPPSLGSTKIWVGGGSTMTACKPRFPHKNFFKNNTARMEASFQPYWPLGFPVTLATRVSRDSTKIFKYLHNVTIYLNHICGIPDTRRQMKVYVEISNCITAKRRAYIDRMVINNVPRLSEECSHHPLRFIAVAEDKVDNGKYHDFFYKDTGYLIGGRQVLVVYDFCPAECQHYNYSIFIAGEDERIVTQHTANVGNFILTSDTHRGFRVSMLIPEKICNCKFSILISKIPARISRDLNITEDKQKTLQLHNKR